MSRRAEYRGALLMCMAGAALLLLASGRDWAQVDDADAGTLSEAYVRAFADALESGLQATVVRALGVAALAGVVAVAATKRRGRQVVGVVLLLIGLYAAGFGEDATSPIRGRSTAWPWVAVAGGVLVACGGLLVAVRGSRWAAMSTRYDGPHNARPQAEGDQEVGLWDAQSRGDDPT